MRWMKYIYIRLLPFYIRCVLISDDIMNPDTTNLYYFLQSIIYIYAIILKFYHYLTKKV